VTVGVLRVRLILREALSLKDKRSIVKGIKDRVHSRFNVGIAEVGDPDARQRAELAAVAVANGRARVEGVLHQVLRHIQAAPGAEMASHEFDYY